MGPSIGKLREKAALARATWRPRWSSNFARSSLSLSVLLLLPPFLNQNEGGKKEDEKGKEREGGGTRGV